jgi:hypothetical protein
LVIILLLIAAMVPIATAVSRVGTSWVAVSDEAAIVLRSRDVLTPETPLVGMPTTLGVTSGVPVHHPGPMGFWPSGVGQAVVDHASAPMFATVVVNLLCVVAIVLLARRLGGVPVAALAAGLVILSCWSFHDAVLTDPYNPYAAHLPLAAFALALVAVVDRRGSTWAWPVAVVAASFAAQSHVSLLAPIAGIALAALLYRAVVDRDQRTLDGRPTLARIRAELTSRPPLITALIVAVVCWLAVVVDLLVGRHNLWNLAFAAGADDQALGLGRAWQLLVRAITSPAWLADERLPVEVIAPVGWGRQLAAIGLLGVAAALAVALRRHRAVSIALVVVLGGLLAGTVAAARIPVDFWTLYTLHSYIWLWPLTALLWGAVLVAVGTALVERTPGSASNARLLAGTGAVVVAFVIALAVSPVSPTSDRPTRSAQFSPATTTLADGAAEALDPSGSFALEIPETPIEAMVPIALALELERRGVDVVSPARLSDMLGSHRVGDGTGTDGRLVLHQGVGQIPDPDGTRLASFVPDVADLSRLDDARADVRSIIDDHGSLVVVTDGERTTYTSDVAAELVANGDLVSLWELDMVVEPTIPNDVMVELRAAQSGPVIPFALDLLPAVP